MAEPLTLKQLYNNMKPYFQAGLNADRWEDRQFDNAKENVPPKVKDQLDPAVMAFWDQLVSYFDLEVLFLLPRARQQQALSPRQVHCAGVAILAFHRHDIFYAMHEVMGIIENYGDQDHFLNADEILTLFNLCEIARRYLQALKNPLAPQIGDICFYSFEGPNKSFAIVEVVSILDDPRGVAQIKFHKVLWDETGNGLFVYLEENGKTMTASFRYLQPIPKEEAALFNVEL